jgi:hypothetical protein
MGGNLSRRGFLGVAAGSAAGIAAAPLAEARPRRRRERRQSREHPARLPKYLIGIQCYTVRNPAAMGSGSPSQSNPAKTNQWLDTIVDTYENRVVETYGNNYGSLSQADWRAAVEARGAYCWGDHNGGNLNTPAALAAAVDRIHNLGTREIGTASDGVVGVNEGGYTAGNYLRAAQWMNAWGAALQANGAPGARYYFHPHQQSYAVITDANNSGMPQYNGMRLLEVMLANLDPRYAFVQCDMAWARHNAALNTNELWLDFLREYEDQFEAYHVKGSSGTSEIDCRIPEDLVPWDDFFATLKHPGRHTYLWERDGPGAGLSGDALLTSFQRFHDLLHGAELDRAAIGAPGNVRPPKIDGSGKAGKVLVCSDAGRWVRAQRQRFSFKWLRDGLPIPDANARRYVTAREDAGREIACEVTAWNSQGTTPENSQTVTLR